MAFECTFHNARFFMRFLEVMKDINPILDINCTENGWNFTIPNENMTMISDAHLDRTFFQYYRCPKPCSLVLRVQHLWKMIKYFFVAHKQHATRLYIRLQPNSSKIHFRMDLGCKNAKCAEFEISQSEDFPKEAVLPEVGCLARVQFPTETFGKLVKDFEVNRYEDTMQIKVSNQQISFFVEGESGKCNVKLQHDTSSPKPDLHLLLDHLEDADAEGPLLVSLKLLSQIVKAGIPLGPYWELVLKQGRPYVFRLPLYKTWKDETFGPDELGRGGSGLKFFQNGFKKNTRCNNNFSHLSDAAEDGLLGAGRLISDNEDAFLGNNDADDNVNKRPSVKRDISTRIDPQKDVKLTSPIENDDEWGIRDGLITFYLPPKAAVNAKTVSFKAMENTPLAKKRRETALNREQNEVKRLPTEPKNDQGDDNPKATKRAKIDMPVS